LSALYDFLSGFLFDFIDYKLEYILSVLGFIKVWLSRGLLTTMFFRCSSVYEFSAFCDLEIVYSILPSATSLKLSTLTKFEAEYRSVPLLFDIGANTSEKHMQDRRLPCMLRVIVVCFAIVGF
jgi:hypothetical protein